MGRSLRSRPGLRDRPGAMHLSGDGRAELELLYHCEEPEQGEGDEAISWFNSSMLGGIASEFFPDLLKRPSPGVFFTSPGRFGEQV